MRQNNQPLHLFANLVISFWTIAGVFACFVNFFAISDYQPPNDEEMCDDISTWLDKGNCTDDTRSCVSMLQDDDNNIRMDFQTFSIVSLVFSVTSLLYASYQFLQLSSELSQEERFPLNQQNTQDEEVGAAEEGTELITLHNSSTYGSTSSPTASQQAPSHEQTSKRDWTKTRLKYYKSIILMNAVYVVCACASLIITEQLTPLSEQGARKICEDACTANSFTC